MSHVLCLSIPRFFSWCLSVSMLSECRLNSLARRNLFWSGGGGGDLWPLLQAFEGPLMAPWWLLDGPLRAPWGPIEGLGLHLGWRSSFWNRLNLAPPPPLPFDLCFVFLFPISFRFQFGFNWLRGILSLLDSFSHSFVMNDSSLFFFLCVSQWAYWAVFETPFGHFFNFFGAPWGLRCFRGALRSP